MAALYKHCGVDLPLFPHTIVSASPVRVVVPLTVPGWTESKQLSKEESQQGNLGSERRREPLRPKISNSPLL